MLFCRSEILGTLLFAKICTYIPIKKYSKCFESIAALDTSIFYSDEAVSMSIALPTEELLTKRIV